MCDFLTREEGWIEDQEQLLVEEWLPSYDKVTSSFERGVSILCREKYDEF